MKFRKIRKILSLLIIYTTLVLLYISSISAEDLLGDFFYTNSIFIILYILIANLLIEKDPLIEFDIYRYKNKLICIKNQFFKNTLNIFATFIGIIIINSIVLLMTTGKTSVILSIYYFINIFSIMEILNIFVLSFQLLKKTTFARLISFSMMILMLIFGGSDIGITNINIFKYILYNGDIINIIVHYAIWFFGMYLLLDNNARRGEL